MSSENFILPFSEPSYVQLKMNGELDGRIARAHLALEDCTSCPRNCGVNRMMDEKKTCRTGRHAIVSSAFAHFGEEYCLSGTQGSGTIFFSSCNLRCVFCQNWDISQNINGRALSASEIADTMLALQSRNCHNINFVTPEHVVPQVVEAIVEAVERGLHIPIVYNTSAYDSPESLELLKGLVDIYMPDFKCWKPGTASHLLGAKNYPDIARASIQEMHHQVRDLKTDPRGIAVRGLLIRHLVLPGLVEESKSIMQWIAEEISRDTYINIMDQYRPAYKVGIQQRNGSLAFQNISRPIHREEMEEVFDYARQVGLWRFDA